MRIGNQEGDGAASMFVADMEVAQSAEVSNGHATAAVQPVTTDPVLDWWGEQSWASFEPGLEGLERSATVDRAVWPLLVVVRAEGVELQLKVSKTFGRSLSRQVTLEGLVEALHLAAGLGVIRSRVFGLDTQAVEL